MAIRFSVLDAHVCGSGRDWRVVHPTNDAILAYCDTRAEAVRVLDAINDMPRMLRGVGMKVA